MPSNFSKWDWDELVRLLVPAIFIAGFGVLVALGLGAIAIHLLFAALFG